MSKGNGYSATPLIFGILCSFILLCFGFVWLRGQIRPFVIDQETCREISQRAFIGDLDGTLIALRKHSDKPCTGEYPSIIAAAEGGNPKIVEVLLNHNANPNEHPIDSLDTAPKYAVMKDNPEILRLFAEHSTNWNYVDAEGNNLLDIAVRFRLLNSVRYLLSLREFNNPEVIKKALHTTSQEKMANKHMTEHKLGDVIKLLIAAQKLLK